jgi:tripartite-type tricarboxylate transporter receptor subunit TctC
MIITRRAALAAAIAAPAAVSAQPAWPTRPVRVINPYAPGGASDIIMRTLAERLERALGQPFIIDNRAGAGGALGTGLAAQAVPDGYTLLVTNTGPLAVAPTLFPNLNYDPARSFAYISIFGGIPLLCAVKGDSRYTTLAEYAAAAAARPEAVSFGSSGVGSAGHLAGVLFGMQANARLLHVPFRGAGEAQQSVLSGDTDSLWDTLAAHSGAVRAGTLRGLALSSERGVASLPQVPTTVQAGFPGVIASNWFLIAGPAGLSPAIAEKLDAAVTAAMAEPAVAERFTTVGVVPLAPKGADAIAAFVAAEGARWAPVVRASGATPS